MWRYSVLMALLLGCSDGGSTVDDGPVSSSKFSPLLCTGGSPGEPTCPITVVELDLGAPLRLTLVATPPEGRGPLPHSLRIGAYADRGDTFTLVESLSVEVSGERTRICDFSRTS